MDLKNMYNKPVGVIGAGSFGTAIANILAEKSQVLLYARKEKVVNKMHRKGKSSGQFLSSNVKGSNSLAEIAGNCDVIFPIVPSSNFRGMMKDLGPHLRPYHVIIHGTKGLDININESLDDIASLSRDQVKTMSEIIRDESLAVRIGCLAGPNLAKELADRQPAATVVASRFDEVINTGIKLLRTERFQVYGSKDLIGVELCGVLKNIIAIASGALGGMGYGDNARALLISRGMVEMIHLGKALGGNTEAFLGLAGVGDLVATCSSQLSRNYTVGFRLAQGEKLPEILQSMEETAEGVNTIKITKKLADFYKVRAPILEMLHKILFEELTVEEALQYLMKYPFKVDIDFL